MTGPATETCESVEVTGVVQGVGFRPFVYRLASDLQLRGHVGNDSARVIIEVAGTPQRLDAFADRLHTDAPPLAHIERIVRRTIASVPDLDGFRIIESEERAGPRTLVPPDTAMCGACRAELDDPRNRRFRHPFINCTDCGPRFSIIERLPYDRPNTSMAPFDMCPACRAEYADPTDRRYHAQPIGCHDCGPVLSFRVPDGRASLREDALRDAREMLDRGDIVAVKGIGGFHLAVDATDDDAVQRLRARKHRPHKPFAVMVADVAHAHDLAVIGPEEERLLTSPASPVVLLEARSESPIARSVAPDNPMIGVMVASTALHLLLFDAAPGPLVMTSANHSGEPMMFRDTDVESILGSVADGLLTHDRAIVAPCDDSVVRMVGGRLLPIRRARGYAPLPVPLPGETPPVLAVGGELKNTFCLTNGRHAWVSPHIGDMGTLATTRTFEETVARFEDMYDVAPSVVAADGHPGYLTSRWAQRRSAGTAELVQHHHAHIAAVMAEHQLDPETPVLGFAFDGTGYGEDGTIWGGEVLRANAHSMERLSHLVPVPLAGGDASIEHPARVALAHLRAAGVEWTDDLACVRAVPEPERRLLARQLETGFGCVPTTSMGRLFDAVASLIGLRQTITYEAQAAIDLEHAARRRDDAVASTYRFGVGEEQLLDQRPVIAAIVADLRRGVSPSAIADRFHDAVAAAVADVADLLAVRGETIVLSGGVFQNVLLVERVVDRLTAAGHDVRTHQLVPPNDGGLALGQAFVAAHRSIQEED